MVVFRTAMTIQLARGQRRQFLLTDFEPLKLHYAEQVAAIHVMAEYASRGLENVREALRLAADYFSLSRQAFIDKWLPGREQEIGLQTSPESWRAITGPLNPTQRGIGRRCTGAGQRAGARRAWLRQDARHRASHRLPGTGAAREPHRHPRAGLQPPCRRGDTPAPGGVDRRGCAPRDRCSPVMPSAMRLCGASFTGRDGGPGGELKFDAVLKEATALLQGEGLEPGEADAQRERLLAGFRWICVDEYQDVDGLQYALISALAGRTLEDPEARLSLLAVGDDDQNIYTFAGASVKYIRRFTEDYDARPTPLIENYRSTRHIIDAANHVIKPAANRMKMEPGLQVRIDRRREKLQPGGDWQQLDPVGCGRVQLLQAGDDTVQQALCVMDELQRLKALDKHWDWSCAAVIARHWKDLDPVRAYCELYEIPVQTAREGALSAWRLRETQALLQQLRASAEASLVRPAELHAWIRQHVREGTTNDGATRDRWWRLLDDALEEYLQEHGTQEVAADAFTEWLAEWAQATRHRQGGLLLLSAHRAKGLEFDHVVVLGWRLAGSPRCTRGRGC